MTELYIEDERHLGLRERGIWYVRQNLADKFGIYMDTGRMVVFGV